MSDLNFSSKEDIKSLVKSINLDDCKFSESNSNGEYISKINAESEKFLDIQNLKFYQDFIFEIKKIILPEINDNCIINESLKSKIINTIKELIPKQNVYDNKVKNIDKPIDLEIKGEQKIKQFEKNKLHKIICENFILKGAKKKLTKKEIPKAVNSRKLSNRLSLKKYNFGTTNAYSSKEKKFGLNKENKGCNDFKNFLNIYGKDIEQDNKNNIRIQSPRINAFSASKFQINEKSNNKTKMSNNKYNKSNSKSKSKSKIKSNSKSNNKSNSKSNIKS
jgi:hypothetical protein